MNKTSPQLNPWASLRLSLLGCAIGLFALAAEGQLLWGFWQDVQKIAPGTPIRPMGLTFAMAMPAAGAFLLGCPVSFLGITSGYRNLSRWGMILGAIGLCLCLAPMPFSSEMLQYLTAKRGMFLEE